MLKEAFEEGLKIIRRRKVASDKEKVDEAKNKVQYENSILIILLGIKIKGS